MKQFYRITTIYGKKFYYESRPRIFMESNEDYDDYNLENCTYYIDKVFLDPFQQDIEIYKNNKFNPNMYTHKLENHYLSIHDIDQLHLFIKNNPLMIFKHKYLLCDKEFLLEFIHIYPLFLCSLIKKQYRKYINTSLLAEIFISEKVYPYRFLDEELIIEFLKNKEYMYELVIYFLKHALFSCYITDRIYFPEEGISTVYNEGEISSMELILPYLKNLLEDDNFVKKISLLQDEDIWNTIERIGIEIFHMDKEKIDCMIKNANTLEFYNTEHKDYEELEDEICAMSKLQKIDYKKLVELLLELAKINEARLSGSAPITYYFLEKTPLALLENKEFLLLAAKKGISLSQYSYGYREDYDLVYYEVMHDVTILDSLPSYFFDDPKFILKIRYICDYILHYASDKLLNDESFMLEYLKRFSSKSYFKLGYQLSLNKDFLYQACKYDYNILFYCHSSLLDDAIFMYNMIKFNYYNYRFLSLRLKKNKEYNSNFSKPIFF